MNPSDIGQMKGVLYVIVGAALGFYFLGKRMKEGIDKTDEEFKKELKEK
jgi:hypothetical protein